MVTIVTPGYNNHRPVGIGIRRDEHRSLNNAFAGSTVTEADTTFPRWPSLADFRSCFSTSGAVLRNPAIDVELRTSISSHSCTTFPSPARGTRGVEARVGCLRTLHDVSLASAGIETIVAMSEHDAQLTRINPTWLMTRESIFGIQPGDGYYKQRWDEDVSDCYGKHGRRQVVRDMASRHDQGATRSSQLVKSPDFSNRLGVSSDRMRLQFLKLKYIAIGWLSLLVGAAWSLPPLDSV